MTILERLSPDPLPAIYPLPEYLASGQRAEWYQDTKQVLQVPWMGVVTMAYAHYPSFFGELWRGAGNLAKGYTQVAIDSIKLFSFHKGNQIQHRPKSIFSRTIMNNLFERENYDSDYGLR